jgi:predicted dinucleotide-binding enzyme
MKPFNGITPKNFPAPDFSGEPAQVLYCGDDGEGKDIVRELIRKLRFSAS